MRTAITCLVVILGMALISVSAEPVAPAKYNIGPEPPAGAPVVQVSVTAKKYEFSPATIEVDAGTVLMISIKSLDKTHGFQVEGFDTCVEYDVKEGPVSIRFYTDKPGDYPFKCCHYCGWHHGSMKGMIKVKATAAQ